MAQPDDRAAERPDAPGADALDLRAQRAERLARLRPGAGCAPRAPLAALAEDDGALAEFLRALTGAAAAPGPVPTPAAVLHFHRPGAPPVEAPPTPAPQGDLDRLPGAGPGLVWALERAGIARRADLAGLAPADLAARLGPIGRLVPAAAWIAAARAAAGPEA